MSRKKIQEKKKKLSGKKKFIKTKAVKPKTVTPKKKRNSRMGEAGADPCGNFYRKPERIWVCRSRG